MYRVDLPNLFAVSFLLSTFPGSICAETGSGEITGFFKKASILDRSVGVIVVSALSTDLIMSSVLLFTHSKETGARVLWVALRARFTPFLRLVLGHLPHAYCFTTFRARSHHNSCATIRQNL